MHHKIFEYTSQDIKQTFCTLKDFKYISHCFERTTQDFVKKKRSITSHIRVNFIVKKILIIFNANKTLHLRF